MQCVEQQEQKQLLGFLHYFWGYPENLRYTIGCLVTSSWFIIYSGKEGLVKVTFCVDMHWVAL